MPRRKIAVTAVISVVVYAGAASATPVRLALIEDESVSAVIRMAEPIERVLRDAGARAHLNALEVVPCALSSLDVRCRIPPRSVFAGANAGSDAEALESDSEIVFVWPPNPTLSAAIAKAADDPASYRRPFSIALRQTDADVAAHFSRDKIQSLFFRPRLRRRLGGRVRPTVGAYYRVLWGGGEHVILAVGRVFGGLGRVAAAGERWGESGSWTGVARGGTLGRSSSDAQGRELLDGLERAGLRWSAVGPEEIEDWENLQKYRADRPDGVGFLSANVILSSAPTRSALPGYVVIQASGTTVALIGLTSQRNAPPSLASRGLMIDDPYLALQKIIPEVRGKADVVVVLADLHPDEMTRVSGILGVDLIWGPDDPISQFTAPPEASYAEEERSSFANSFPPLRVHHPAFGRVEVDRHGSRWAVTAAAELLDDSILEAEGFPEFPLDSFVTGFSTAPPLLPSAAAAFPADRDRTLPIYRAREFWTIAAAQLAESLEAEAAVLLVRPLAIVGVGDVPESYVRSWLDRSEKPALATVSGAKLKQLSELAEEQKRRENAGLPLNDPFRLSVSGLDSKGFVRGAPLDFGGNYRVATTASAAAALNLGTVAPGGSGSVADAVLRELRARVGTVPPDSYGQWAKGDSVSAPGLWRVNFREIGLNVRESHIQSPDAFSEVVNSRVQGSNELFIGGALKTDVEYLRRDFKWTNTVEAEYAKDRIAPRGGVPTTNLAANRLMFLTLGTRRIGGVAEEWLAHSWGPSMGFEADGEFEAAPGLGRKQTYSVFPGVEFFDGSVVKTLAASGIIKRDLARQPPNTQTGLRFRALASTTFGPGKVKIDAEVWNNYFFLSSTDAAGDLRLEGDANARLSIPVFRHLSIAPFVDFYWFELKVRPIAGYSVMTGVSISFSRLWKPQFEPF